MIRIDNKLVKIAFFIIIFCSFQVHAQNLDKVHLNDFLFEIRENNSQVSIQLLDKDISTIQKSLPKIKKNLRDRGFTDEDVQFVTILAWKDIRINKQINDNLSQRQILMAIKEYGKLQILSKPNQAFIYIDGKLMRDKTDTTQWLREENYKITIKKKRFTDWNKSYFVRKGKLNIIDVTLVRKKK